MAFNLVLMSPVTAKAIKRNLEMQAFEFVFNGMAESTINVIIYAVAVLVFHYQGLEAKLLPF